MGPDTHSDLRRTVEDHERALATHQATIEDLGRALLGLTARIAALERDQHGVGRIAACEAWLAAEPRSEMLLSVVTPTRDRSELVARAIASVQAQTHVNWEMLVVDDASEDDTAAVVAAIKDPRVRLLRSDGSGVGHARNVGLDNARGNAIVYLDDDNRMLPLWLAAVAWAFERHPERDALYGARIHETLSDSMPELQFEIVEPDELAARNPFDTNVIAHRRDAVGARWDEGIEFAADWDLAVRLAAQGPLLPVPVRAVLYSTSLPGRLSESPDPREQDVIRRRAAARPDQNAGTTPPIGSG
jgi:glycosyl transferase family 2